jgi:hypothetical protein
MNAASGTMIRTALSARLIRSRIRRRRTKFQSQLMGGYAMSLRGDRIARENRRIGALFCGGALRIKALPMTFDSASVFFSARLSLTRKSIYRSVDLPFITIKRDHGSSPDNLI